MQYLPTLLVDGYKVGHIRQYPKGTTLVYSNLTARKGRDSSFDGIVFYGLQAFIKEYLIDQFNKNFFNKPLDEVLKQYARRIDNYLGKGAMTYDHIADLHKLGYLPICIKAVPEGTFVPYGVPCLTIYNTDPKFFWITNSLETLMSTELWKSCTSATSSRQFRKTFEKWSKITVSDEPNPFVMFQGHDFSFRGMSGVADAALSGSAHLLSFVGTDTVPAIDFLEYYYGANVEKELVGVSVPATEHSVMCMGLEESERETFRRLVEDVYPSGIVSIVSDTWDFWNVITNIIPSLKTSIMARNGKTVCRPDSGCPVKIIVGDPNAPVDSPEYKGAIQCLDETFGHTITSKGYKVLDSHIGLIYGEQITRERQEQILSGLAAKGYASDNVVLGVGSYNYQYVTRDTHGFAIKATYGETEDGTMAIYKAPKTDTDGVKKSAKGLLKVYRKDGKLTLQDQVDWSQQAEGELEVVFFNGKLTRYDTLAEIRALVESGLHL